MLATSWCLESRVTGWLLALLSSWRLFLPGDEDLADLPLAPGRQEHQPLSWPTAKDKPEDTQQRETWGQPHSLLAKLSISACGCCVWNFWRGTLMTQQASPPGRLLFTVAAQKLKGNHFLCPAVPSGGPGSHPEAFLISEAMIWLFS